MTTANSQFFAILTAVGEAKQANANALGVPWTFSQMAVGDANLTDPVPSREQAQLINERRRAPLNQLKVDPANPNIIIAEQVIPPDVGGWWIREIGLYDAEGDLVAVANCAPSFKPLLNQGTGKTQVVRLNIIVTSTANVQLKIDPAVVLATRSYVDAAILEVLPKNKTPGEYTRVKINDRGLVVSGDNPSTLAENGITDAYTKEQVAAVILEALPKDKAPGEYTRVKINDRGLVISGDNPSTLADNGITDAYTREQVDAIIAQASALPFAALEYPTVATADGRLAVTGAAVAGTGGSVSVPAGVMIALAEADIPAESGRPRVMTTMAWTSAALPVNSTYYLRASIKDRALLVYVAPGTDSDAVPASLRSDAGQAASGFDSTVIDVLLAKVVTGAAGSAPTVTALANKKRLEATASWQAAYGKYTLALNWARTPRAYVAGMADYDSYQKTDYTIVAEPLGNNGSGQQIGSNGGFSDRYVGRVYIAAYAAGVGDGVINVRVRWEA
ncbi:phage tail protein [Pseudomonas sp. LS1212]|uniref:phage tail protein n=1 Tax=Pseudomonas sp. LS1212 TaxID=2972478 RepID=UPI00215CCF00|nr:phage tail protein [Pseudomonas sp. LS1212]UVJ45546.1 phage tail protein [Pseudomonas sp. LS1212]